MPEAFLAFLTLLKGHTFARRSSFQNSFSITPILCTANLTIHFWKTFLAHPIPGKNFRARYSDSANKRRYTFRKLFPPIQFLQICHAPIQFPQSFHANPISTNLTRQSKFLKFFTLIYFFAKFVCQFNFRKLFMLILMLQVDRVNL